MLLEVQREGGNWDELVRLSPEDKPGSVTQIEGKVRQMLIFGYRDGAWGVWLSKLGIDISMANDLRMISSASLEQLSDVSFPYVFYRSYRGHVTVLRFTIE